jgi:hypothetical protein
MRSAWTVPLAQLARLADRYHQLILVTEIGYRSVDGAARAPWDFTAEGPVDLREQAEAYQAALERLCSQPWLGGIYWWYWSPRPQGGLEDTDFTPRDKPAEAILREYSCTPPAR